MPSWSENEYKLNREQPAKILKSEVRIARIYKSGETYFRDYCNENMGYRKYTSFDNAVRILTDCGYK